MFPPATSLLVAVTALIAEEASRAWCVLVHLEVLLWHLLSLVLQISSLWHLSGVAQLFTLHQADAHPAAALQTQQDACLQLHSAPHCC